MSCFCFIASSKTIRGASFVTSGFFSSSGFGESTTDVVFAGNALIYENGVLLAASERFSFDKQLVMSEIDVERLRGERLLNTTFAASVRQA